MATLYAKIYRVVKLIRDNFDHTKKLLGLQENIYKNFDFINYSIFAKTK